MTAPHSGALPAIRGLPTWVHSRSLRSPGPLARQALSGHAPSAGYGLWTTWTTAASSCSYTTARDISVRLARYTRFHTRMAGRAPWTSQIRAALRLAKSPGIQHRSEARFHRLVKCWRRTRDVAGSSFAAQLDRQRPAKLLPPEGWLRWRRRNERAPPPGRRDPPFAIRPSSQSRQEPLVFNKRRARGARDRHSVSS